MNKIEDKRIQTVLDNAYSFLKTQYDEDRILGAFVQGNANYGFAESEDEINIMMCYLPTFEELCTTIPTMKTINYKDKEIVVVDVRKTLERALAQKCTTMEAVFTKYYILNPRYKQIFHNDIYMNREALYHTNHRKRVQESLSQAAAALELYKKYRKNDDLFNAVRLKIASERYMEGTSVENCIFPKQEYIVNYLWSIKQGTFTPNIEDLQSELDVLKEEAESLEDGNLDNLVKKGICEIIKLSITDAVYGKNFLNILTKNEVIALEVIKKHLKNGEGNISTTQLIEESGVSRPVFKSLTQKMQDNRVAEVVNQGVKGTYIKMLDAEI